MGRGVVHHRLVRLARRVVLEGDGPGAGAGALFGDGNRHRISRRDRQRHLLRGLRQRLDPRLELALTSAGGDVLRPSLDQVATVDSVTTPTIRNAIRFSQLGIAQADAS